MNNSGKTLTIFLFVIAVLLISLTAIAVFFFLKEVDLRKAAEYNLEQMRIIESKLQGELKESKKQMFLLEEKNKEAEDRVESLMEEVDLEKGLRDELKKENRQLQDALQKETAAHAQLKEQSAKELSEAEKRIASLQEKLDAAIEEAQRLEAVRQDMEGKDQQLGIEETPDIATPSQEVSLDKIVVNPAEEQKGKVISVDRETEFLIVNLGEKDGIKKNSVLSVYRGETYLGDVKVSRVLPEMAAADLVPPLTSQNVQKDDRVIIKE